MYHLGGGVQGRGGSYSVLYIFTCLVLFVFTVNKLVNVKIYFLLLSNDLHIHYLSVLLYRYRLLLVHVCTSVSWPIIVS